MKYNPLHLAFRERNELLWDIILKDDQIETSSKIRALNQRNKSGETPLHYIFRFGDEECLKKVYQMYGDKDTFLEDITNTEEVKKSPFQVGCRAGNTKVIKCLIRGEVDAPDDSQILPSSVPEKNIKNGKTALYYACEQEDETIVSLLIDHDYSILAKDERGRNLLHVAARMGRKEVAEVLLKQRQGLQLLKEEDKYHETPLFHAVRYNELELVNLLLKT